MKRWGWMLAIALGIAHGGWSADKSYEDRLLLQLELTAVTAAQEEAFREALKDYHAARNGSVRRVSRQGGDIPTRVARDLRRLARRTLNEMGEFLEPDQLEHVEKYLELANEQYMTQAGLR
ncbi:MAG: hypothetical protein F4X36_08590 [Gammaproteobacteria bacterium]|nr:hypothetical protein [Gammaproteobacteria bacterium]